MTATEKNQQLKRAMFLLALAALRDPISVACYARKISQGNRHNTALIAADVMSCSPCYETARRTLTIGANTVEQ